MKLIVAALLILSAHNAFAAQYSEIASRCTLGGNFQTLGAKYNGYPSVSIQKIVGTDRAIVIAFADDAFVDVEEGTLVESAQSISVSNESGTITVTKKDFVGTLKYRGGEYTCSLPQ